MKTTIRFSSLAGAIALAFVMTAPASATVLTFQFVNPPTVAAEAPIPQEYGDRVSASPDAIGYYGIGDGWTPNVQIGYSVSDPTDPALGVIYTDQPPSFPECAMLWSLNGSSVYFTATADAGYGTIIKSFDLMDYAGWGGASPNTWAIYAGSVDPANKLFEGTGTTADGERLTVNTGMVAPVGGNVILAVTSLGSHRGDNAFDNLNFSQAAIPEPSAAVLLILGLAGMGLFGWARRKSRA